MKKYEDLPGFLSKLMPDISIGPWLKGKYWCEHPVLNKQNSWNKFPIENHEGSIYALSYHTLQTILS